MQLLHCNSVHWRSWSNVPLQRTPSVAASSALVVHSINEVTNSAVVTESVAVIVSHAD